MEVKEIQSKEIWENFLLGHREKTFLQSWNWGEFQKMMGHKIWRLGIYNSGELFSAALAVKVAARRGTFLLVQHATGMSETLLNRLKEIAKGEGCSFIRVAPLVERNEKNEKLFQDLGFRTSPMHASAYEATWKLDITKPEEELLRNMRKTTRYLVRQAEKNPDIEIVKSDKIEDVVIYDKLNQKVARHQQFVPFSFQFIKNEFEAFAGDDQALLFFGKYQGEIIASALVIFWSGIGFYHQAALDPKYHKIPISYLLMWGAIKEAKKRGCQLYDFWGFVDPFKNLHPPKFCFAKFRRARHPWAGPTLFKMGFGGRAHEYLKTRDLSLSKKYWLTYAFEKLRKTKRGL